MPPIIPYFSDLSVFQPFCANSAWRPARKPAARPSLCYALPGRAALRLCYAVHRDALLSPALPLLYFAWRGFAFAVFCAAWQRLTFAMPRNVSPGTAPPLLCQAVHCPSPRRLCRAKDRDARPLRCGSRPRTTTPLLCGAWRGPAQPCLRFA